VERLSNSILGKIISTNYMQNVESGGGWEMVSLEKLFSPPICNAALWRGLNTGISGKIIISS
jgi:hypothetical protein